MKSNILHTYNKVRRATLTVLCLMLLFSCVKVDLCVESEHVHVGNIKVVYHWPDGIEERPDSMLVLINRVVNANRIGYVTGAETSIGGRYRFGREVEAAVDPSSVDQQPLIVSGGEYQLFAFNNDIADVNKGDAGIDDVPDYRFENLSEFSDGVHANSIGIHDLSISYVGRERTDPRLYLYGKDWVDFNPYSKYIATDTKPIYRAVNPHDEETQEYTFTVQPGSVSEVHLYPQKITQDITFSFPVYVENQVGVDSIIAEISGIPRKMIIYTTALESDTTYKMLFKIGVDREHAEEVVLKMPEGEQVVDRTFTKFECMSTISVMGLLANNNPKFYTGAGILQLCIYSHAYDADGVRREKTQYAKINLYNTITKANLVITDAQGRIIQNPGIYPELPRTDTLRIDESILIVTRDLVLETADRDENGVDSWAGDEDGDGEVDDRFEIEF